MLLKEK